MEKKKRVHEVFTNVYKRIDSRELKFSIIKTSEGVFFCPSPGDVANRRGVHFVKEVLKKKKKVSFNRSVFSKKKKKLPQRFAMPEETPCASSSKRHVARVT